MYNFLLSTLAAFITVTAAAAGPSGLLPVMYINTENNVPVDSKEDYVDASYYLDPNGCEGVSPFGSAESPLDLQIRGRGNYTWIGFDKKPYRLKLGKKQKLMGMDSSKHWALLAHADDNRGFLRNAVGFQLSRMAGLPWTPCDAPVEVVLNGQYIGLYFLTETVRVDSKRVNVWDYDSAVEDYADAHDGAMLPWDDEYATGGWLVEIDNYEDTDQVSFESKDTYVPDKTIRVTYDTPSDFITESHKDWLLDEFRALDALIVDGDRDKCEWASKIDMTDLARFFIVNQIVFNYESFHGSCKLWRDKGENEKWHFGPVWDFGSAFQTQENEMFFDYGPYSNHWIKTLYEYPAFREEVKRVYAGLRDNDFDSIYGFVDSFAADIRDAAAADKERWPDYGNDNLDGKASDVKDMLRKSVKYLDSQWGYTGGQSDTDYVYFIDNNAEAWPGVYVFTWNPLAAGNWPGTLMQRTHDLDGVTDAPVWKYVFGENDAPVEGVTGIIFGNGGAGVEEGNQTADFVYHAGAVYNMQGETAAVTSIENDAQAPVEYFNLQGIRVSDPAGGIYIRRCGNDVRKVRM